MTKQQEGRVETQEASLDLLRELEERHHNEEQKSRDEMKVLFKELSSKVDELQDLERTRKADAEAKEKLAMNIGKGVKAFGAVVGALAAVLGQLKLAWELSSKKP